MKHSRLEVKSNKLIHTEHITKKDFFLGFLLVTTQPEGMRWRISQQVGFKPVTF